jgi:hypothetical protein
MWYAQCPELKVHKPRVSPIPSIFNLAPIKWYYRSLATVGGWIFIGLKYSAPWWLPWRCRTNRFAEAKFLHPSHLFTIHNSHNLHQVDGPQKLVLGPLPVVIGTLGRLEILSKGYPRAGRAYSRNRRRWPYISAARLDVYNLAERKPLRSVKNLRILLKYTNRVEVG